MSMQTPSFTVGIEEEYMLVDPETRKLISETPSSMLPRCEELLDGRVSPEFLQCQIEVGTSVCKTIPEAREELAHLRRTVSSVAAETNCARISWGRSFTCCRTCWRSVRRHLSGMATIPA